MDPITNAVNTENFFKFSFLLGAFLVVFGFVYPIEKSHELDLEVIEYNQKVRETNYSWEISLQEAQSVKKQIDDLNQRYALMPDSLKGKMLELKNQIKRIEQKSQFEEIKIKSNQERIKTLETHIKQFQTYRDVLLILGVILLFYGGWHWHGMSRIDKKNKKLLSKKEETSTS